MIHSSVGIDHYSRLKVVLKSEDGRNDVQTPNAKIVITTGLDSESASCINNYDFLYL